MTQDTWEIEVYVQSSPANMVTFTARFATQEEADAYQRMMLQDGHATIKTQR